MQNDIQPGMTVRSSDGDKLGKIMDMRGGQLIIEKGFFFPKDYTAPMEDVAEVTDDGVYLRWGTDLVEANYDSLYGSGSYSQDTAGEEWSDYEYGSRAELEGERESSPEGEERIPVHEEQLEASKKGMKDVGRIRVHKNVRTEEQHFSVPVRREEVTVERVKGGNGESRTAGAEAFQEETKSYPIREEEVEITKRPVLKEEVRVHSHEEQEERPVSGTVRKEDVQIDEEDGRRP